MGLLVVVRSSSRRLRIELKDWSMVECWIGLGIIVVKRQGRLLGRLGVVLMQGADWRIGLSPSMARRVHLRSLSLSRWWLW